MSEMKLFDTLILGTIISDIALRELNQSEIHEAVEYIVGHPVWTHELTFYMDDAVKLILEQHPSFLKLDSETIQEYENRITQKFGKTASIERGTLKRKDHPLDTLMRVAGGKPVIVITSGEK